MTPSRRWTPALRLVAAQVALLLVAAPLCALADAAPTAAALQQAIAECRVDGARSLLEAGADPNARDARKQPIVGWLASGTKCTDGDALEVARLLESHGATFDAPRLLVNLAPRHLPKTLAFLATKRAAGDPTAALHAIARGNDAESMKALLDAGADPLQGVAKGSSLLDATLESNADAVALMLAHVTDKTSPKVLAADQVATRRNDAAVIAAFRAAGVVPPATVAATPSCAPADLDAADQALLSKLGLPNGKKLAGLAGPMQCKRLQECGDLVLIDCNSAADGPAYYIDRKAESVLATCGGACMAGCSNCPPKQWTCSCTR